ncbi:hypothetical protein SAMN05428995_103428 [Loktanella sp. DSM 29012]|uniref:DUF5337 domain-containing protein n=1 Tax=Loktanella gaetbuli TaxID=2881335 RepID=A0ABS8BR96_9RHOB|nr:MULTISPECIES: DUF5337 domain-containing protein [Loktanella]KQI68515.1 hypothetical protein AN189_09370 [Loktanella sp. 3ANDIMAR09]MCB5198157.1 DUF5337 domain-containing protein [Loktanella gaetbuli]SEQ27353.1 hypothetical protein SAMN05428995_103428 [Loktanella sp. DSM 29012]
MSNHTDDTTRQGRIAALVIAGAGLLAILAPWLVAVTGLAPRFEILFYLISLAAFIWSLVVTVRIWQKTR